MKKKKINGIRKKFDMFEGVEGRAAKVGDNTFSSGIDDIVQCFVDCGYWPKNSNHPGIAYYAEALERVKKLDYDKEMVQEFVENFQDIRETEAASDEHIGLYASALINNLLRNGGGEITLAPKELISRLGYNSRGIKFNIKGDAGIYIGVNAGGCTFNIEGNAAGVGAHASGCKFNVSGSAGGRSGSDSKECEFNIKGNAGHEIGYQSKNSKYVIEGYTKNALGNRAEHCTFTVLGNAGEMVGFNSRNCFFILKGDAGEGLAEYAIKGEFHVDGKISLGGRDIYKGTVVYHKGKKIFPKWWQIWRKRRLKI